MGFWDFITEPAKDVGTFWGGGGQAKADRFGGDPNEWQFGAVPEEVWSGKKKKPASSLFNPASGTTAKNPMLDLEKFWKSHQPGTQAARPQFTPSGLSGEWQTFLDAGVRAQMAPLESLLQSGNAELQRRAGEQKKLVKLMPGQINQTTDASTKAIMDLAKTFGGVADQGAAQGFSLAKTGVNPMLGTAPGLAGLEQMNASHQMGIPYLESAGQTMNMNQKLALQSAYAQAASEAEAQKRQDMIGLAMKQFEADQGPGGSQAAQQDWNKAWLGILADQGGGMDEQSQFNNQVAQLQQQYPADYQGAAGILQQSLAEGADPTTAMQQWVAAGDPATAHIRGQIAQTLMGSLPGFGGK